MGQTILITGTSSGIGKASALRFHAEGGNVVATMRNPQDGEDLAALSNVLVTRLDVLDESSIDSSVTAEYQSFIARTVAGFGAMAEHASEASAVADVTFTAATDGSSQLRYTAGNGAAELMNSRKNSMTRPSSGICEPKCSVAIDPER